jgi:hypothetical protein
MSWRLVFVSVTVAALEIWSSPGDAAADSVPKWDVTTSCRGAAEAGFVQDTNANFKRCVDSEQRTREQLTKDWSTFPAADRVKCVKTQTFSPTYSELATCLEMSRDLRNDAKPADAVSKRK